MKRKGFMVLVMCVLLVGCGSAATVEGTQEAEGQQKQEVQSQEEIHTHVYAESITTEATCEGDGVTTFTCECGDTYSEAIPATGHVYEEVADSAVEATCDTDGKEADTKCTVCEIIVEGAVVTAKGHSYGEYIYNNDASYIADGTETATCVCGLTETRTAEGSKLEYTYTDMDATMYAKQSVNVRDLPTSDGNKLGGLSLAQEVKVLGQCSETSWYKIEFDGSIGYVSNKYLADEKPVQQTVQANEASSSSGNTYILEGTNYKLEYGVMYLNVCGHNLTGERVLSRSQGPFPHPLGQLIDNGDGTYTVYIIGSHGYFLDGQFYIHDTSATSNVWSSLEQQGYSVSYAGGDTWHACVGGYDQGCIKKLVVTK